MQCITINDASEIYRPKRPPVWAVPLSTTPVTVVPPDASVAAARASLLSFLAAVLTLIAFAIDIALYVYVKHQMGKLTGVIEHTSTAPGAPSILIHPLLR